MVTAMDNAIGQIVDAFKAAGKYDDTIFIFSSDVSIKILNQISINDNIIER